MTFWTMLMFKVPGDQVRPVAKEWARRRIIEESKETVPGFISGELMSSTNETGQMCVLCNWENEASYQQWADSPVRARQFEDEKGLPVSDVHTKMFLTEHRVSRDAVG